MDESKGVATNTEAEFFDDREHARATVDQFGYVYARVEGPGHGLSPLLHELQEKLVDALLGYSVYRRFLARQAAGDANPCLDLSLGLAGASSPLRGVPASEGYAAFLAGFLVLRGLAEGPLVRSYAQAEALVDDFDSCVSEGPGPEGDAPSNYTYARNALVDALVREPDWRERAFVAEGELEGKSYLLRNFESSLKEVAGPGATSMYDVKCKIESLEGEVLAERDRRDEVAAFALGLLEFVGRIPGSSLPEDLDAMKHAIQASPRSRESEEVSLGYLRSWRERDYAGAEAKVHDAHAARLLAEAKVAESSRKYDVLFREHGRLRAAADDASEGYYAIRDELKAARSHSRYLFGALAIGVTVGLATFFVIAREFFR